MNLTFSDAARIHLPLHWTAGTALDATMPVGSRFPATPGADRPPPLVYPLVLIESPEGRGGWLEVSARSEREYSGTDLGGGGFPSSAVRRRPTAVVQRTARGLSLTFESGTDVVPSVREVPSLGACVADHVAWMRAVYGIRPLAERIAAGAVPAWAQDTPAVFTFDMWRPSGEVAHSYTHLRDFVRDLHAAGVPPGVVLYLPGWCAPYDGGYPEYRPAPELGGRAAFGEAIAAAHAAGYRVMIHTLAWGADPSRPDFERLAPAAVRNWRAAGGGGDPTADPPPIVHPHQATAPPPGRTMPPAPPDDPLRGPYVGWPGGGPRTPLDFDSGRVPLGEARPAARGWTVETAAVPQRCEAVLTLGGLRGVGDGTVRMTLNGRTFTTPAGWFRRHRAYTFPFTFVFLAGPNLVELTGYGWPGNTAGPGGPPPDLRGAWYRIAQAYDHPGPSWTIPAVGMDPDAPLWRQAFLEHLSPTVAEFGVDAVHVDATPLWRWDERGFLASLKRALPSGTVFGTEVATTPGLGFFLLSQTRVEPPRADGDWTPSRSELSWQITGQFQRFYQHLCAPRGFVPVGSVCTIDPVPRTVEPPEAGATERVLAWSREQHILPNLRVNYRDYGLDPGTRAFLLEHVVRACA